MKTIKALSFTQEEADKLQDVISFLDEVKMELSSEEPKDYKIIFESCQTAIEELESILAYVNYPDKGAW